MMYNHWLKVWWNNSNPKLIASYYIEAARKQGGVSSFVMVYIISRRSVAKGVPLITQSDPGTENYGVANMHTVIRQRLDPSLTGTLQHRWMRKHANIKPEINWRVYRQDFTPGFEDILDSGVNNGWYNVDNPLEK
jgi:hypothetical protein